MPPPDHDPTTDNSKPAASSGGLQGLNLGSIIAGGGTAGAVALVIYALVQFGVIGEGAQLKASQTETRIRAVEDQQQILSSSIDLRLIRIESSLVEIKESSREGLTSAEFELYMERIARLNPSIQLPPTMPTSTRH